MAEQVILLHGLSRDPSIMQQLSETLRSQGYQTHNIGYPSTSYPIRVLVEQVYAKVRDHFSRASQPVHCVGHSLGALIIRLMIQQYCPRHLGRVVMLAPPNHGTPLVDFLKRFRLYQKHYGPAGMELGTDEQSIARVFKSVDYSLGILAGNSASCLDWILSKTIVPQPNDGKVPVQSTQVEGMADHLVVPVAHPKMPNDPIAIAQTLYFLRHGCFEHA